MTDVVDQTTRSRMMAGIKGKNTRPEILLRCGLHGYGFRFRLHVAGLPGHPDLCLRRYNAVIFVHGCFWHRHDSCRYATFPKSREDFWLSKFAANVARDARNRQLLTEQGWRVAVVWECCFRLDTAATTEAVSNWLRSSSPSLELSTSSQAKSGELRLIRSAVETGS
jgi:DNA mismatch endonuclease, patch repair protein